MPIKSCKLIRIHSTLGCTAITGHRVTATQMKNMVNLIRKSPKIEIPIKSKFKVIKILIQRKYSPSRVHGLAAQEEKLLT